MRMARSWLVCVAALACLASPEASAGWMDFQLVGFGNVDGTVDGKGFGAFSADLGLAIAPHGAGPAQTTGSRGFAIGYQLALTDIDAKASHWTRPVSTPQSVVAVSQLSVRKGLPYSFELGGILSHVHESSLWAVALELRWALVEGYEYAPDFGLRVHGGTLLGSRDISMVTAGLDGLVSKQFGLGGLVQLTPYLGYSLTFVHATSHVLGRFAEGALQPSTFLLPDQNLFEHRGLIGLRVVASIVDLAFEAAVGELQTYSLRAGFTF